MCHVHHLSTQEVGENLQIVSNRTPIDTKYIYPIIQYVKYY